jgi:hypothetical protein
MPKRVVDLRTQRPCLDIASFGRRGPEAKLTPSEVASIAKTAHRVPEVMIKVSGGARTLQGVGAHFYYIGREGVGEIETDMGERLNERGFGKDLMLGWDLDLDLQLRHTDRAVAYGRRPPKLVHNLIFSTPLAALSPSPEDEVEAQQSLSAIIRVLEGVSPRTCEIYLAHRAGYTYDDISGLLSISHITSSALWPNAPSKAPSSTCAASCWRLP